ERTRRARLLDRSDPDVEHAVDRGEEGNTPPVRADARERTLGIAEQHPARNRRTGRRGAVGLRLGLCRNCRHGQRTGGREHETASLKVDARHRATSLLPTFAPLPHVTLRSVAYRPPPSKGDNCAIVASILR